MCRTRWAGPSPPAGCSSTVSDRYDFALVDCPPHIGLLTYNALQSAGEVIIPVDTGYFSLQGLSKQLETVEAVRARRDNPLEIRILANLYDVRTKLGDAARVFGPQKGARPQDVVRLERRLRELSRLEPYADLPGSGAAGGLGAALAALGANLVGGAATVLNLLGFEEAVADCDLVVTGEGAVDETTSAGKAPGEVARRSAAAGVRCVVFGGRVRSTVEGAETVALSGDPSRAEEDLVELGRRLVGKRMI